MAARVPDPSLGVPRPVSRLGEPGNAPSATPRAGLNRCATGPGVASGPQVTPGQGWHAHQLRPGLTKEVRRGIPPPLLG